MIKETKKAPIIRFRDFTDDWEQRKFDEIASRESSTGMSSEILPSVEYEDVISEVGQLNKDIAEKAVHKKGIKFDKIHVLYGKLRPYLHNWINPRFKGIAVGDWWVLKPVATDKDFLYRLIQTKQFDDIANLSTGSKMPRADWNLVSKSEFMIPGELKEQHLIGQCFSNLDNLITLHQRKLDQLKTLKKYFLQNMFPAKGEKVPRIRFKGFTGDWEQRKLVDIATMHARIGWQNLRTSEFLDDGDYYLITGTDFKDGRIDFSSCHYVAKERYDQDKNIQIHNGSILITKDGTLGKVAYISGLNKPATLNAGVFNVVIKANDVDEKYLYHYLAGPFLMDYVSKRATGGTIKHLNQNILVDFPVVLPSYDEQKKIGETLQDLDNLITLHQRKLDKLQTMKKLMLQNMFI